MSPSQRETRGAEAPRPPRRSRRRAPGGPRRAACRPRSAPAGRRPSPSARVSAAASPSTSRQRVSRSRTSAAASSVIGHPQPEQGRDPRHRGPGALEVEPLGRRGAAPAPPPPRRATWRPIELRSGGWNRENVRRSNGSRSSKVGSAMPLTHSSTIASSAGSWTSSTASPDRNPSSQAAPSSAGAATDSRRLIRVAASAWSIRPASSSSRSTRPATEPCTRSRTATASSEDIQRLRIPSSSSSATPR